MTFSTSYYARINEIRDKYPDYILVSISGGLTPEISELIDIHDKRFAPNLSLFKEYKDNPNNPLRESQYVKRFKKEVLEQRNFNEILKSWSDKYGNTKKYILLCYEKPEDFCHRQIVAEALEQKYSIEVSELFFEDNIRTEYKIKIKDNLNEDEW